ncbi:hypothetical protein CDV36_005109 [Fusarium kuroshium]|uniref:N-acetyltransferase domain-containing protein n=1 Tax=Fusarium kuroshium TaxID=2010991 RepID=A0A3M2SDH0_9HYPO|nr:hypothetical protein CDV36_005109 [Fusarium kuroshium]
MYPSRVRLAEARDVDLVTNVLIMAMEDNQCWQYQFPHSATHYEDHWNYTRDLVRRFLSTAYDDWIVMVLEIEVEAGEWDIVAVSVWDVSYVNKRIHGRGYRPNSPLNDARQFGYGRGDADHKHVTTFLAAEQESNQRWGMDMADRDGVVITFNANPQSTPHYERLGFGKMGQQVIQAPDEEEAVVVDCLAY